MLTFQAVDDKNDTVYSMEFSKDFFDNTDKSYAKYRDAIDTLAITALAAFLGVTEYEATALMAGESISDLSTLYE